MNVAPVRKPMAGAMWVTAWAMTDHRPMPPARSSVWATMTSPGPTFPTDAPIGPTSFRLSNRENHLGPHAAVDQEPGPGHVSRLVGEQLGDAMRDVDGLSD